MVGQRFPGDSTPKDLEKLLSLIALHPYGLYI